MCERFQSRKSSLRYTIVTLAIVVACAVGSYAQIDVTDRITMKMTGSVGYGYSGSFGNISESSHASGFQGNAVISGHYFHPNFLSFNLRPYYDRNKASSESQTLTTGKGFGGSVSFFSGSRFPGSVTFGQGFATNSEFRAAGVPSVSGDSSSRSFGVSWSALFPDRPTLTARYSMSSGNATLLDSPKSSNNASKDFSLNSSYNIAGFDLTGNYSWNTHNYFTPAIFIAQEVRSHGTISSYGISAQHELPFNGGLTLSYGHSTSSNDAGSNYSTSTYNAGTTFSPWHRLSIYNNASYTTNLTAAFAREVFGETDPLLFSDRESYGLFNSTGATLNVGHGLSLNGRFSHRLQGFNGTEYEDSQYGGTLNYNRAGRILGLLYFSVGVIDTASKRGNDGLGLNSVVGMNKKFKGWETSADFNYSHNVQTLLSIVNTSLYSYGGSVRRKVTDDLRVGFTVRASHSGMVVRSGDRNRAESFSGSLGWRRYNLGGTYSRSNGTAVLSSSGELTPTPVGSILTPDVMLFNARSYSFSGSAVVARRFTVAGGFSSFQSDSQHGLAVRNSDGQRFLIRGEYRVRKFSLQTGFQRSNQQVNTIAGGPRVVNSFYLSLSRWFNVF